MLQLVKPRSTELALLSFFERVARKDDAQIEKIAREHRFSLERDRWSFTLPDLHRFLQGQDGDLGRLDYKQFRRLIFASPVNQVLKSCGAEITLADNRGKADLSRYALVWRD